MFFVIALILVLGHIAYFYVSQFLLAGVNKLESQPIPTFRDENNLPSVSLLMAVRNEEYRLPQTLKSLELQTYPAEQFELVFVNDRSHDATSKILADFKNSSEIPVKIVDVFETPLGFSPKKYALQQGMLQCNGSIILSTDADCQFEPDWIRSLVSHFDSNTGMVVGMTTYYNNPQISPLLWGIQSLEFFSHAVVASSMIANQFPINTNANNMAYRKEAYLEASHGRRDNHIVSGDDDFLLQLMSALGKWKIIYATTTESQVQTEPTPTLRGVWEQRKRWGSKTAHYEPKQVVFLSGVYGYYLLIVLSTILGFFYAPFLWLGVFSWTFKSWLDFRVIQQACHLFNKPELLNWFIPAAIVQPVLVVMAIPFGMFGKFTWKDGATKKTV